MTTRLKQDVLEGPENMAEEIVAGAYQTLGGTS